ncbi:MAG: Na/Pi symporter [Planctomycetes bacterium]|nr:Na/Pi symporter [Planctomycetota bacterium]
MSGEPGDSPNSDEPGPRANPTGDGLQTSASGRQILDSGGFSPPGPTKSSGRVFLNLVSVVCLLYVFLVGINCLSGGIKGLGGGVMDEWLSQGLNPMLGLLVGILATTLVQSSSVTTSLIVGFVASGQVEVADAIPMIMGANIGTTVTNTIASLAHAKRSGEFERAFAAATCHDFFNFLAVVTLLPAELITQKLFGKGFLEMGSHWLASQITAGSGTKVKSPIKGAFKAGKGFVEHTLIEPFTAGYDLVIGNPALETSVRLNATSTLLAVAGLLIIFGSLSLIVKVMRKLVMSRLENYVNRFLGSGGPVGIIVGMVLTVMVQSSSITTSVLVPLAGAGLVTLVQVFPITLGANIGTTITALLASAAVTGDKALAARQIALVHLGFNLCGIAIWYVPPFMRRAPLGLATGLAKFASKSRGWAVFYVVLVFYGLPAGIFFLSKAIFG